MVKWPGAERHRAFLMNGPRAAGTLASIGAGAGMKPSPALQVAMKMQPASHDALEENTHESQDARADRAIAALIAGFMTIAASGSPRRGAQLAHGMRGSRQHAALEPGGRGIREQDRADDRQGARNRRQVLLAALDRARTHAHHLERGQLRSYGWTWRRIPRERRCCRPAVSLDVRARVPQRQGHRHQESARSTSSKKLRVGVFQVSAIRQALSEHGVANNTVVHYLSHNADDRSREPALLSGAASHRRLARYRGRLGSDGRILQSRQTCAADHQAGQLDGGRDSAGIQHDPGRARGDARHQRRRYRTRSPSTRRRFIRFWWTSAFRWSNATNVWCRAIFPRTVRTSSRSRTPRLPRTSRGPIARAWRSSRSGWRRARIRTTNWRMRSSPTTWIAWTISSNMARTWIRATAMAIRRWSTRFGSVSSMS